MGEVYKECGVETNSLKSFSDRVQEELTVFYTKVSCPNRQNLPLTKPTFSFQFQGIGDLREEIEIMEESRTDYRAALSWLRATSVDPDKLGQIEKFRRVQAEVKQSKERFDIMKSAIQVGNFFSSPYVYRPSIFRQKLTFYAFLVRHYFQMLWAHCTNMRKK